MQLRPRQIYNQIILNNVIVHLQDGGSIFKHKAGPNNIQTLDSKVFTRKES